MNNFANVVRGVEEMDAVDVVNVAEWSFVPKGIILTISIGDICDFGRMCLCGNVCLCVCVFVCDVCVCVMCLCV